MAIDFKADPPPSPGFQRAQIRLQNVSYRSTAGGNLVNKRYGLGTNRWAGTMQVDEMDQTEARAWKAWVVSMTGQRGEFRLSDPGYPGPSGDVSQQGYVDTGVVRNRSAEDVNRQNWVVGEGYTPNTTVFEFGDQIEIAGELKIIVSDTVETTSSGRCLIRFLPHLRATGFDKEPIVHDNPKGSFMLDQSVSKWDDETIRTMLEFPIIEKVRT